MNVITEIKANTEAIMKVPSYPTKFKVYAEIKEPIIVPTPMDAFKWPNLSSLLSNSDIDNITRGNALLMKDHVKPMNTYRAIPATFTITSLTIKVNRGVAPKIRMRDEVKSNRVFHASSGDVIFSCAGLYAKMDTTVEAK